MHSSTITRARLVRRASTLAMAAGIGLLATPAMAQDAAPAKDQASASEAPANEILVTAEFRAMNLQDTPLAITAINAEMLEARSQTRISDITAQAPNVL